MEYFSADWHLNHYNKHGGIIKYCNRPFTNVQEMNKTIYDNAISKLKKGDIFYFLGDLSFDKRSVEEFFNIMKSIGVQVHFIFGNHDVKNRRLIESRTVWSGDLKSIKVNNHIDNGKFNITLCHYAMRVWPKSHFNSFNLHGHSHSGLSSIGKQLDVGVDGNNFNIWSIDEISEYMNKQPDNFNYIKNKEDRND